MKKEIVFSIPRVAIATIGYGLGVPLGKTIYSPSGRPFKFARDGELRFDP